MTDITPTLEKLTAIIQKGEEPACSNALKRIWDLVRSRDSPNRRTVYRYTGLVDAIINVINVNEVEIRRNGCGILRYISRCADIKGNMYQHNGLIDVLDCGGGFR